MRSRDRTFATGLVVRPLSTPFSGIAVTAASSRRGSRRSVCSNSARALSTSIPKYRTVLSHLVWPSSNSHVQSCPRACTRARPSSDIG